MSTSKRIISLLLALVMVLGMLPWDALGVEAAGLVETVRLSIESAKGSRANPSAMAENSSDPTETTATGDSVEVTRAQWVQELVKTFSMTVEEDNYPDNYFSDLTGDEEYYRDILVAVEFGVIDLEAGLPFEAEAAATREFCAHTLNFCLGYQLNEDSEYTFAESQSSVYPDDIQIAINRGWFVLKNGEFLPDQAVTTEEMNIMMQDAAEVLASDVIDPDYQNTYEFTDEVIKLSEQTAVYWESDGVLSLFNPSPEIQKGDIFAVYEDGFPLICKADAVTVSGSLHTVSVTRLNINDYLLSVDAQGMMETDLADFEPAEGMEAIYVLEDGSRVNSVHAAGTQKIKSIYLYAELMGYKVDIEVYDMVLKWHSKGSSLKNADVSAIVTGHAFYNVTIPFGASVSDFSDVLSVGSVPIGPFGRISVTADISLDGSVSFAYGADFCAGVEYSYHSGFRIPMEFKKTHFSMCAEANIRAGVSASAGLSGIPLLSATCRATIGLQVNCTMRHRGEDVTPKLCIHTDAWLYCTAGAYATVGIKGWDDASRSWSDEIVIWDRNHSPVRSVTHFEDGSIVGKCSFDDFGMIRYYSSGNSRYVNGGVSAVNNSPTYTYTTDEDGNATITGFSGNVSSISIPATIDGHPVTAIGSNAFSGKTSLYSVTLPSGVVSIGGSAFKGCTGLRDIRLPDTLVTIGGSAFRKCTRLLTAHIPDSVTTIDPAAFGECTSLSVVSLSSNLTTLGASAFHNCDNLTSITLPKTIENIPSTQMYDYPSITYGAVFAECDNLKNVYFEDGTITIHQIMNRCNSIESITVPATVTVIGYKAFQNCTSLKTVDIADSVVAIQSAAFGGCTKLTDVVLPPNLTTLGSSAFHNCDGLTEITLPKTITNIPSTQVYDYPNMTYGAVFAECDNLKNVYFEDGTITIHQIMNRCNSIESITVPATVTEIGYKAFQNCTSLKTVDIPDSVVAIQSAAFGGCTKLTDVVLPPNLTTLGSSAFHNCDGLTEITLPKTITNIPSTQVYDYPSMTYGKVFAECDNLQSVEFEDGTRTIYRILNSCPSVEKIIIPNSVTKIDNSAFGACTNLKEMEIPSAITSIGNDAFNGCTALKEIVIPKTVTSIGTSMFSNCTSLECAVIHDSITVVPDSTFANCVNLVEVSLPDTMTSIKTNAFKNCDSLIAFVIPKKVSTIGNNCFYDCDALTSITIPYGVTAIGSSAFYDCDALETVDMANSVTSLGNSAFKHCDALKNVDLSRNLSTIPSEAFRECAELEEIVIPYFTTKIDSNAFNSSPKLTKVVAHEKLATINTSAFSYADRTVFYGSTGSYTNTWCTENGYSFVENTAATTKVTAAENSVTIPKGKTYMLDFDIDPIDFHEIITTKSSNTAVATVDETGKITAVAPGTATIKIIVGGVSASCEVTVTQAVTKITLDKTKLSLDVPQTYQLTATITPSDASNKNLIWTSSNESAATVDENGLVTAVGNGTAVIKAEAADGSGISASCTVTVIDPSKIPVSSITLDKTTLSLEAMETYQLTASVSPANAANKTLTWTSSNEAVATVDSNGQVTAVAKGTVTITAAAADGYGASASCTVTVTSNGYIVTSLDHFQSSHPYENSCSDFWLYTQPGAGSVSITFDAETEMEDGFDYLYIYDGEGKLIGKYTGTELAGQTITIPGSTVKVQIESDDSGNAWGFRVTNIGGTDHTHSFTNYVSDGNATCTEDGTKTAKCDHCGLTDTIPDTGSALGHSFGNWNVIQHPTASEEGLEERICARCGYTEQRSIASLENPFTDVPAGSFFYEPVMWAVENGITSGTSATTFGPGDQCMRAHVVTFLWKAVGSPEPTKTSNPFVDVKPTDFFYKPVLWALENGITSGVDATHFGPASYCNRAQVITFLYQTKNRPAVDSTRNPFTDVPNGQWFTTPVLWAVENGITSGLSATSFGPGVVCNRAQIVTFLYKAFVNK